MGTSLIYKKRKISPLMYPMLLERFRNNPPVNPIISPRFKLVRELFHYEAQNIRKHGVYIKIMLHRIQRPSKS